MNDTSAHRRITLLVVRSDADVLVLAGVLRTGDVILTDGNTRGAALVRRVTRSLWAHVSVYVGPLEAGDDARCAVEAHISAGVRAVPLSAFKGQRARIVKPRAQLSFQESEGGDVITHRAVSPGSNFCDRAVSGALYATPLRERSPARTLPP